MPRTHVHPCPHGKAAEREAAVAAPPPTMASSRTRTLLSAVALGLVLVLAVAVCPAQARSRTAGMPTSAGGGEDSDKKLTVEVFANSVMRGTPRCTVVLANGFSFTLAHMTQLCTSHPSSASSTSSASSAGTGCCGSVPLTPIYHDDLVIVVSITAMPLSPTGTHACMRACVHVRALPLPLLFPFPSPLSPLPRSC